MTLERILRAAVNSMIYGHHAPHCYSAHVLGKGYVNDGSKVYDREDYLRQLQRTAQSEIDNMGYAVQYAERGYTQPDKGILFANWNSLPTELETILDKAGYEMEWSDEWTTCEDCNRAFRTQPDSYGWTPAGRYLESISAELCNDCIADLSPEDRGETEDDNATSEV